MNPNLNADIHYDTPHAQVPEFFNQHNYVRRNALTGMWVCEDCGVLHTPVPVKDNPNRAYLVALEARKCPPSFEELCPDCGQSFECPVTCPGVEAALELVEASSDTFISMDQTFKMSDLIEDIPEC